MDEKELKKQVKQKGKKYIVALWAGFALCFLGDFFGGQYRDFIVTGSMFVFAYGAWNLFKLKKRLDNRPKEVRKKELKNNSIKRLLPVFIISILLTNVILGIDDKFSWGIILFTDVFLLAICLGTYKLMSKII